MTSFPRTLVIDTATTACSVALLGPDFDPVRHCRHEQLARGHAERLIPMVAELPGGGRADHILVDVGPGSFTGVRVGLAAARGLALGWGATVAGYSSLSLIAQGVVMEGAAAEAFAVVIEGGHGEVFMQRFAPDPLGPLDAMVSATPPVALARLAGVRAFGSGTGRLTGLPAAQDGGTDWSPVAAHAGRLPAALRQLPPKPLYGRAPDATPSSGPHKR